MLEKKLQSRHQQIATYLALAIIPLSGVATDIFIPSLPAMVKEFHTTESTIRLSITLFLISYGLSQFISGALVDAWGRYKFNIISMVVFILSNVIIMLSNSIEVILAARFIQGISAGAIATAKRTLFIDVHSGEKLKHYLSIMSIIWSLGPIIAPFIGGYLEHLINWRACFAFLGLYALVILILELIFSGETIKLYHELKIKPILKKYLIMIKTPDFIYGVLICSLCYSMVILFGLVSSFIVEYKMGFSPIVAGYVSLILGFAWMAGGFIGKALMKKDFLPKIQRGNAIQFLFIVAMLLTTPLRADIFTLVFFAFAIHVCAGFMFNNYFAYCLGRFPDMAGLSGGLIGGMNYILCSFFSYGLTWSMNPQGQSKLSIAYLILASGILLFLFLTKRSKTAFV
ncbi:Bcr/CflA family drug resistance efflux transporter [Neptunitalea chrysea]|uniref:Bcr/CflA family drug resistance efflux transporter n=1 Tax=Neptunitalea chrysea TaxID=1647581 RepID=A0A9W6EVF0_9FLAO|nr:MFS transporter [Neptunitalea chrysea]GLB51458.1 Bcr/CflA family drug resistance efflux transporter [Neptunitalea chrysea]